jgi:hypothetical protein
MKQIWSDNPEKLLADGDMSQSLVSEKMYIRRFDLISFAISWSGNPSGTFTVEASNDEDDENSYAGLRMKDDVTMTTANSTNPFLINLPALPYRAVRVRYTRSGGTGVLNIHAAGKQW